MVATTLVFAASSIFGLSLAAPLSRVARPMVQRDATYKVFGGDGSMAQGWPASTEWSEFDAMWDANSKLMTTCPDGLKPNSDAETKAIKDGIEIASKDSGLDKRFILAVIMQESGGCVRVGTTYSPPPDNIRNPGIMQDFKGEHTCNDPKAGTEILDPCPDDQIKGMVTDGAGTTNDGGLKQAVERAAKDDDSKYYLAARMYNSGSVDPSGNLGKGVATHCYASDIANRLTGWLGEGRTCDENTIGTIEGSTGTPTTNNNTLPSASSAPSSIPSNATAPSNSTTPTFTAVAVPTPVVVSSATPTAVATDSTENKAVGAAADCTSWYAVKAGDTCSSIESSYGLPAGTLQTLNESLDAQCTTLLSGTSYCLRNI